MARGRAHAGHRRRLAMAATVLVLAATLALLAVATSPAAAAPSPAAPPADRWFTLRSRHSGNDQQWQLVPVGRGAIYVR